MNRFQLFRELFDDLLWSDEPGKAQPVTPSRKRKARKPQAGNQEAKRAELYREVLRFPCPTRKQNQR